MCDGAAASSIKEVLITPFGARAMIASDEGVQGMVRAKGRHVVRTCARMRPCDAGADCVGFVTWEREERQPAEGGGLEPHIGKLGRCHFDAPKHPPATDDGDEDTVIEVLCPMFDRCRWCNGAVGCSGEVLDDECVLERRWAQTSLDAPDGHGDLLLDVRGQSESSMCYVLLSRHAEDLRGASISAALQT